MRTLVRVNATLTAAPRMYGRPGASAYATRATNAAPHLAACRTLRYQLGLARQMTPTVLLLPAAVPNWPPTPSPEPATLGG